MLNFVQVQGRRKFSPQEYIEYFEDSAKASLRAKFEPNAEIGQKGVFCKGLVKALVQFLLSLNVRYYCPDFFLETFTK